MNNHVCIYGTHRHDGYCSIAHEVAAETVYHKGNSLLLHVRTPVSQEKALPTPQIGWLRGDVPPGPIGPTRQTRKCGQPRRNLAGAATEMKVHYNLGTATPPQVQS